MTSIKKISLDGTIEWRNNAGRLQREDRHALEWANGSKAWYLNGKCHREDGPAIEWAVGEKEWFLGGKRHRVDGPAIEFADGRKVWYLNGIKMTEQEHVWRVRHRYFDEIDDMPEKLKMEYLLVFG